MRYQELNNKSHNNFTKEIDFNSKFEGGNLNMVYEVNSI